MTGAKYRERRAANMPGYYDAIGWPAGAVPVTTTVIVVVLLLSGQLCARKTEV